MQRATFGKRLAAQTSLSTLDRAGSSEDAARFVRDILETSEEPTRQSRKTPAALEHVAWSYFKACVVAFVTAVMLMGFAHGVSTPTSSFLAPPLLLRGRSNNADAGAGDRGANPLSR